MKSPPVDREGGDEGEKEEMRKWTPEQFEEHWRAQSDGYGQAIVFAAFFKKVFGRLPEIGLSGSQASGSEFLVEKFRSRRK